LPASTPTCARPALDAETGPPRGSSRPALRTQPREGIEDDLGKPIEVADQERERKPTVERLLDEVGQHVFVGGPSPEQACERDVDDDQRRGQENATSPLSSPKPESMYCVKTSVKRSMTPVFIGGRSPLADERGESGLGP